MGRLRVRTYRPIAVDFRLVIAAALVLSARCPAKAYAFPWSIDMFRGDAVQPMAETPRMMPPGTLPVDGERHRSVAASRRLQSPLPPLAKNIDAGRKLYSVYCSVCHGPRGRGDGPVAFMLRTPPADLTSHRVAVMKDGSIYGTIGDGTQIMPSYGDTLLPDERWRIVLFIRDLQSRDAVGGESAIAAHALPPAQPQPRPVTKGLTFYRVLNPKRLGAEPLL